MPPQKDVPIARRVNSNSPIPKKRGYGRIVVIAIVCVAIAIALITVTTIITPKPSTSALITEISPTPPITSISPTNTVPAKKLLGHFAYEEAPLDSLEVVAIASDGYLIKLRSTAAKKYKQMTDDAKADRIKFTAISGFRTKEEQRQLFFEISRQRNQTPAQRAKVSAPAGYSEHHTGYAVDIGDSNAPSTNLSSSFDQTNGFKWLQQNASKYSFELSFPQNNPQGVMYEPWHWRFVGDDDSLATFYKKNR
jgi:zinc D-Ala-D-Ala carboxypeptidase